MQQFLEFLTTNQDTIVQCFLLSLVLVATFLVYKGFAHKPVHSDEEFEKMPESKKAEVMEEFKQTRYQEKKVSKTQGDLNRFGRFRVVYFNGKEGTKIGKLSDVLSNSNIKTYREIK